MHLSRYFNKLFIGLATSIWYAWSLKYLISCPIICILTNFGRSIKINRKIKIKLRVWLQNPYFFFKGCQEFFYHKKKLRVVKKIFTGFEKINGFNKKYS